MWPEDSDFYCELIYTARSCIVYSPFVPCPGRIPTKGFVCAPARSGKALSGSVPGLHYFHYTTLQTLDSACTNKGTLDLGLFMTCHCLFFTFRAKKSHTLNSFTLAGRRCFSCHPFQGPNSILCKAPPEPPHQL